MNKPKTTVKNTTSAIDTVQYATILLDETVEEHNKMTNETADQNETDLEAQNETKHDETAQEEVKAEENFKDKYFYLAAEMQNMQKRFERERTNLVKFGNENILKDLIEVVDSFELTLNAIKGDQDAKVKNIFVGIEMVHKQCLSALKKHGLEPIEAMGKEFDPNFHEAVAQEYSDEKSEGEILQVHQTGYLLNSRVLRASKVVVATNEDKKDKKEEKKHH